MEYRHSLAGWVGALVLAISFSAHADSSTDRLDWFRDARFGMFIHFGVPSQIRMRNLADGYETVAREFNPVDFDAGEWVKVAKEAGAKYIVFTSKHHNGFSNWDSALTDWDIVDQTAFGRDIIAELSDAARAEGIRLGFYYSIADWHHPEFDVRYGNRNGFHYDPNPDADIAKYMLFMYGQIQELCDKYQSSLFWFDGSAGFRPPERKRMLGQQEMVDLIHSCGAISNSRLGDDDGLRFVDYLNTGDNMIPASNIGVNFETAGTMNESWHFNPDDEDWKSSKELLSRLVDIAGKGGNYLLNVGPTELGVIPDASVSRLKTMGEWLGKNGEAIYGTGAGPYPHELGWGSMTQRKVGENTHLYLHVVDWPDDGALTLYGIRNSILSASLLVSGKKIETTSTFDPAAGIDVHTLNLPGRAPDPDVSVIKLVVAGDTSMGSQLLQQADGVVTLDGYQALVHDLKHVPGKPQRIVDHRIFTVMQPGEGIMPAHGLTVGGFNRVGQALSWDFRLVEPGSYEVAVIRVANIDQELDESTRMRATVAGQSIENRLIERDRMLNPRMSEKIQDSLSVLGTIDIVHPGAHTLTLEVTAESDSPDQRIRSVVLSPVAKVP